MCSPRYDFSETLSLLDLLAALKAGGFTARLVSPLTPETVSS